MSSQSKEEILANFQSITGIDDLGEAFSHLENSEWDLVSAIQSVIPQDNLEINPSHGQEALGTDTENTTTGGGNVRNSEGYSNIFGTSPPNAILDHNSFALNTASVNNSSYTDFWMPSNSRNACSNSNLQQHNANVNASANNLTTELNTASSNLEMNDLTFGMGLDDSMSPHSSSAAVSSGTSSNSSNKFIHFSIHFDQRIFDIRLLSSATIEQLKRKIQDLTDVPICRQAIRGWPPGKIADPQKLTTKLCHLGLSSQIELVLNDLTEEGYIVDDLEKDEISNRLDKTFKLTIVEQPSGVRHELNFLGRTSIQEVKTKVFYVTDIPVRHQIWTGWPLGSDNDSTLAQSGIQLAHNFTLQNASIKTEQQSSSMMTNNLNAILNNTSNAHLSNAMGLDTDSSADEFEDASDFNNCDEFFTDPPSTQPTVRHLIPNNVDSETTGTIQFVDNYKQRFGEPMPIFFVGSLEEALNEACHKPARERKLLAIYLHHGESILSNVFCSHLLMHESILQTFAENFLLYGWDLTHESNKHLLLSSVTACISSTASLTVRNTSIDKLPSILIIGKSRLSGRTTCEVLSVIHGNVGLDDLLSRLLESVEMYNEQLQVEIAEEDARAARDQVKAEQDMAYQEALQADIAKEDAKRQKEAALAAEQKRLESERVEEEARRESIRLVAEQLLPIEPSENDTNVTKIRVRKPTGEFIERRFSTMNTLQDLFNFVTSQGFLIEEYKLISSWPRRDLTSVDDATQTLHYLKLYPQETVILEER